MKIKYITEDGLLAIRSNTAVIKERLQKNKNITIQEIMGDESIIKETGFSVSDFQLDMSQPKGKESLTDLENIKRVYNHMKSLSDSQASDERIWAAYSLSEELVYMRYRWGLGGESDLKNRYLFNYSIQRSLFRNGISRLWWIGRATYDESREDPYELTKFICNDQDYIENICGRNIFNNPVISKATLSALVVSENNGVIINRHVVREIGKYMNLLAGTYILDALDYDEVYGKVNKKIMSMKG